MKRVVTLSHIGKISGVYFHFVMFLLYYFLTIPDSLDV